MRDPNALLPFQEYPSLFRFHARTRDSDYAALFPGLPSFAEGQDIRDLRDRLGRLALLMDAGDPRVTVSNPLDASADNLDNPNTDITVGFTFLGQFIDHDQTLDPARLPRDDEWEDPVALAATISTMNLRSPLFDLDSVYGPDPQAGGIPPEDPVMRMLYDRSFEHFSHSAQTIKFLLDPSSPHDLPRNSQLRALIADPRNDENLIVSQLHLVLLKLHNRVMDYLTAQEAQGRTFNDAAAKFEEARRLVRWHYQYVLVEQYLKASLDPTVYQEVKDNAVNDNLEFYKFDRPKMPREYQVAAFRFGHSQVRPGYTPNRSFGAPVFDPRIDPSEVDPDDLRGGTRSPRRFVEWNGFFDFGPTSAGGNPVKKNKKIDTKLSSVLFALPAAPGMPPVVDPTRTLAGRTLLRHIQFEIPSGQLVAHRLGYGHDHIKPNEFPNEVRSLGFDRNTPLWYYILHEAQLHQRGERLGKVGSRIVAEVFFGLLLADEKSYWSRISSPRGSWIPELPRRNPSAARRGFNMVDLLTFAGVA